MSRTYFDKKKAFALLADKQESFLQACGQVIQNEFVNNSPVKTGALRNSMTYNTSKTSNINIHRPDNNESVIAGSNIEYAAAVEAKGKSAGWMSRVWDSLLAKSVFEELAKRILNF